jgi:hypothetical protein
MRRRCLPLCVCSELNWIFFAKVLVEKSHLLEGVQIKQAGGVDEG